MNRIETYCQQNFLIHFLENKIYDEFDENYSNWNYLFDLITKRAEIIIDSTKELETSPNPRIKKFLKQSTSGGSTIYEFSSYFQSFLAEHSEILKTNPTSVYFLKNYLTIQQYNFGLFISDISNYLQNISKLSVSTGKTVHPLKEFNNFSGWSELESLLPARNAVIIADNYFLDKEHQYDKNVYALINSILPDSITEDFHISIITKNDLINPQNKFKSVSDYLKSLKKPYEIRLGLFLTALNKPHDRDLVSNYFRINVGNSFDLFNEKGLLNKNTTVSFFPLNTDMGINTHYQYLQIFAQYTKTAQCIGDKTNRLLDYFR
jgi:hypothetical protein